VKEIEKASSQKASIGYGEVFFGKNYLRFYFVKSSIILLCHSAKSTSMTPNLPFSFRFFNFFIQKNMIFYFLPNQKPDGKFMSINRIV